MVQALRDREAEAASLTKSNAEASARLQKALESLTASQVAQRRQAAEHESKVSTLTAAMARVREERDKAAADAATAGARANEASGVAAQLRSELAAATAEKEELLTMCNQLLSQVEQARKDHALTEQQARPATAAAPATHQ